MSFVGVICAVFIFKLKILAEGSSVNDMMVWPNAVVPFYIASEHYDSDQVLIIMQVLSQFSYKTCLKFAPFLVRSDTDHILIIENPEGLRKCTFDVSKNDINGPFRLVIGYDCMTSPNIEMMIMRALGFPFEHNRAIRHLYIDVQYENIEPDALRLFAKDHVKYPKLRHVKYDFNSVMHFDERAFSKNGHRTFIFKNPSSKQNRQTLSESDLRKIQIVYGNECVLRDRDDKIEACQAYGTVRNKRDITYRRSLRINPEITAPPELNSQQNAKNPKDLFKELFYKVYNVTEEYLATIKDLICSLEHSNVATISNKFEISNKTDVFGIKKHVTSYINDIIRLLTNDLSKFCNLTHDNGTVKKDRVKREVEIEIKPESEIKIDASIKLEPQVRSRDAKTPANKLKHNKYKGKKEGEGYRGILRLSKNNEEFYADRRWPNGIVPYVIDENVDGNYDISDLRKRINEVNRILKKKTCVRLHEITPEDAKNYKDYLVLNTKDDYVTGRVGGRQEFGSIELFAGGQHRQHTAMMVMSMLGFYFEVSRQDRDKYVRVHNRHIRPDKLHHFEKLKDDAKLNVPYDYESAMQPAWQFWRRIGKKGISSIATYEDQDPSGTVMRSLGQNEKLLSDLDISKINTVYKCL